MSNTFQRSPQTCRLPPPHPSRPTPLPLPPSHAWLLHLREETNTLPFQPRPSPPPPPLPCILTLPSSDRPNGPAECSMALTSHTTLLLPTSPTSRTSLLRTSHTSHTLLLPTTGSLPLDLPFPDLWATVAPSSRPQKTRPGFPPRLPITFILPPEHRPSARLLPIPTLSFRVTRLMWEEEEERARLLRVGG